MDKIPQCIVFQNHPPGRVHRCGVVGAAAIDISQRRRGGRATHQRPEADRIQIAARQRCESLELVGREGGGNSGPILDSGLRKHPWFP